MSKASVLTIRVPSDLKDRIASVADEQGVSINQLAMYMFTKELGNLEANQVISRHWKGFSKSEILSGFDEVMGKIKARSVPDWDKISG
jgi:HicB family